MSCNTTEVYAVIALLEIDLHSLARLKNSFGFRTKLQYLEAFCRF